ncbi:MAG: DEAD/DEAH box helicase [Acidimicrobiales bacterium]
MTTFADLGLNAELVQAVEKLGYDEPTPIQEGVIPLLCAGRDVIGQAQTGTGKTAAFALPILNKMTGATGKVQALVVCPTRELANQVSRSFKEFAHFSDIRVFAVYGGQAYGPQRHALRKGVDIVVGTPGRLLDLIRRGDLDLSHAQTIALDEADEMLSMGFVEDIEIILKSFPNEHQTLLFSATMPSAIRRLADNYMVNAESVTIKRKELTADNVNQRHYLVNDRDRTAVTVRLLESEEMTRVIIFGQTRVRTTELASALNNHGFAAEVLNGDLSQEARERVMSRFRNDQTKILVATDVAARGLDVDNVSHVINYNLPTEIESYVHRIGRTARAGKTGTAISLVSPSERGRLSRIEKLVRATIPRTAIPSTEDIQLLRDKRLEEKMDTKLRRGRFSAERTIVDQLVADGHDPLDIASAALRLNRALDQERDIPHVSDVDDRPQKSRPSGRGGYKGKGGPRSGGYKGKGGHKSGGYKGKSGGKPGQQTRKRNKNASS